ncbi:hypothetical protein QA596_10880 [Balneolales bacterium ANBcel1]|nr:hypothetical protein [Balneolales bacterium ANBcel1]
MKFFTGLFLTVLIIILPIFGAQAKSSEAGSGLSLTSNLFAPSIAYTNTNLGSSSSAAAQDDEDGFHIGGALRYNIVSQHYESDATATSTYATFDTWRLNVSGQSGGISLNFEYRFYPTFNTHFIKQGWLGYDFSDALNMQIGVTQVPFGNLMYNSHSWWFNLPYYLGMEDDFNMGIKFSYDVTDDFNIMAAYFRQQEPAGPAYGSASFGGPGAGTYSYNVIPDDSGVLSSTGATSSIQDWNQFNIRAAYTMAPGMELGVSGKLKGIYNSALDDTEYGHAVAAHADLNAGLFNIKLQFINYDYSAKDDAGNDLERVQMGAYGDPYYGDGVAAGGNIVTAGIAYSHDVNIGPITNIQPYINYSYMTKDGSLDVGGQSYDFEDTHMLVPGFLISAGSVFTYVDLAMGKNQPWLTDSFGTGLGAGHLDANGVPIPVEDLDWNVRFNINIGYYF